MDITLESSVGESFCAVVDESDEFQQLVGVTLDSSVEFDDSTGVTPTLPSSRPSEADSHAAEDEALPRFATTFQLQSRHPSRKVSDHGYLAS